MGLTSNHTHIGMLPDISQKSMGVAIVPLIYWATFRLEFVLGLLMPCLRFAGLRPSEPRQFIDELILRLRPTDCVAGYLCG
jgi:hypothetical protein